jgi:hypothetical protein
MPAKLLLHERKELEQGGFVELVLWKLPKRTTERPHGYKYRLAYVRGGKCVLRYDNETGKGDHRHVGSREELYQFTTVETLLKDFMRDVRAMGRQR